MVQTLLEAFLTKMSFGTLVNLTQFLRKAWTKISKVLQHLTYMLELGRLFSHGIRKTWIYIQLTTIILAVQSRIISKFRCWYGIPPEESSKFDELARRSFPESFKACPEFLRHKTYLINPLLVRKNGINVHKAVQKPGEFIITFAKSYHAGFNMG